MAKSCVKSDGKDAKSKEGLSHAIIWAFAWEK